MAYYLLSASAATTLLIFISILIRKAPKKPDQLDLADNTQEPTVLARALASALPERVILPYDTAAFKRSFNAYWAQQECEVIPACVLQPCNAQQLCTAIHIIKSEFDRQGRQDVKKGAEGLFAIRSGGHSPIPGAASIKEGVVIDLSLLCEVVPSADGTSVTIGAGAKWMAVSQSLGGEIQPWEWVA